MQKFPATWQDPLINGEHLLDPTTLALAHCASLLLHHPIVYKYKKDRNNSSNRRCSTGAEDILDIIHLIHKNPKIGNYMLPHPLVIAARVRLWELLEQRGHYRGRDTDLVVSALHTLGKNWGLQGKNMLFSQLIHALTMNNCRKAGRPCRTIGGE